MTLELFSRQMSCQYIVICYLIAFIKWGRWCEKLSLPQGEVVFVCTAIIFETDCGFYFSFLDKDFSFIENRTFRLWRFSSCWAKWAYMVRSAFNKKLNEHLHKKSNLKKVYLPGFLERMENRSGHQILASNIAFYTRTSNNTVIRSGLK